MEELLKHKKTIRVISDAPDSINNIMLLIMDYVVIAISITLSYYAQYSVVYIISVVLIGSRMRALMNLVHEASHNCLILNNARLNFFLGKYVCAFPIFMSYENYKASHMRHHVHFSDPAKDPDLVRYRYVFGDGVAITGSGEKMEYINTIFNIVNFIQYSYIYPLKEAFKEQSLIKTFLPFTVWLLIVLGFYQFGLLEDFILYWIIPYLTVFKFICYSAELFEHFGLYQFDNNYKSTRNTYVNKLLASLFWPHGDNYHLVHHLYSFVPGYKLAMIDAYLDHHIQNYRENKAYYSLSKRLES